MTRAQWVLVAVIAVELVGAVFALRPQTRPVPPTADLTLVDPVLAEDLRAQAARCDTPDEWAALGEAYLAFGYFPEGEACYRVAAERERDRPERAYQWAFALERVGKLEQANAEYERAAGLGHPHPDECRYFIGRNWLRLGREDDAGSAFEAAGAHPAARYERARLHARAGRTADAVAVLDALVREQPNAVQPYLLRHRLAPPGSPGAASDADRAERARGRLPTPFDREWERLEAAHARAGLPAELTAIEQAVARRESGAEGRVRALLAREWSPSGADLLAEVELQKSRPAEAVRLLREAIDREGPSVHLLGRLGDAHEAAGQGALAAEAWGRGAECGFGASAKRQHAQLTEYYEKAGNASSARWHAARAHLAAGHELFWSGRVREARGPFEAAVEVEPGLAPAWFYLGETERLLGRPVPARRAYDRCLALDPDHGRALAARALLPQP